MDRKGKALIDGKMATIVFERIFDHAPEDVWEAISTPEGLAAWLMTTECTIDGRAGGAIEMVSGPAQYRSKGKILVWDPPRVLEYEWNVGPVTEMPLGQNAIFRYDLIPRDGSTHLKVTYTRMTKEVAGGFLPGLHVLLDRLEAQLDHRALPDWATLYPRLRAEYPEWSHAPDPAK